MPACSLIITKESHGYTAARDPGRGFTTAGQLYAYTTLPELCAAIPSLLEPADEPNVKTDPTKGEDHA